MSKTNLGKKFLSELKLYSDYLKWQAADGRYENFHEACDSIIDGHRKKYSGIEIEEELASAVESMKEMRVFASQRTLQFRGPQIERSNLRLYNCSVLHAVKNTVFQEVFFLGLNGCGVGISLLRPFVNNLSKISSRPNGAKTFIVEDSIEGWADSLGVLMSSYFSEDQPFPEYAGYEIRFDYSSIRPKGSFISGGFKAPGHEGLKNALEKIEKLIEDLLRNGQNKLKPINVYDIICHSADAILSGGVRRSALNMIVDPYDDEMIHAKTGNWRQSNPQRSRSNNSVLILRSENKKEYFDNIVKLNHGDNDIGFAFANSWFDMFNPCVSSDSLINTPNGLYFPEDLKNNDRITLNSKNFASSGFRKTGIKKLLEIETEYGRKIKVTHEHLMFTDIGLLPASTLVVGDKLSISNNTKSDINFDYNSDNFKIGYLIGSFLGDGNFIDGSCQIKFWGEDNSKYHNKCIEYIKDLGWNTGKPHKELEEDSENYSCLSSTSLFNFIKQKDESIISNKRLSKKLLSGDYNYINGLIAGYFDADGTVSFNQKKGHSVRISSVQLENLENIQIALNSIGVYSKIYKNRNRCLRGFNILPDGNGGSKTYPIQNSHELCISKEAIKHFTKVNILNENKKNIINTILNNYSKNFYKQSFDEIVVSITELNQPDDVYDCTVELGIEAFECNGFCVHNCFEISFTPVNTNEDLTKIKYEDLETWAKNNKDLFGVQLCNLTSINAEKLNNKEQFLRACKDASILGTLQAGYTNFPYLSKASEDITKREALLGVSITGWMNNPKLFNADWLQEGAKMVLDTNEKLAKKLGINIAARTTCVKPEGNLSVIAQTASGIHPEHSERYFRIMQLNKESDTAKWLTENSSFLLEESVWSANNTDYVVFIPVTNPKDGLFKKDMKGVKHLKLIKLVQENWVIPGTRVDRGISPKINHNVSNTVIIDNQEEICNYIWENKDIFTAVSFISDYGDKDFNQAPFTSILSAEEIFEKYGKGSLFISGLIVDGLHYFNNNLWEACDCILDVNIPICGTREQVMLKKYWVGRAKKFAKNYFKNDIKQMIYCLKDVHLCHKWEAINRQIKEIDFGKILPEPVYKDVSDYAAVACAGGSCELTRI
jgi:intein/homing endonuclease